MKSTNLRMNVVQFAVDNSPKHILSLIPVDAKIERVQRSEPLIPDVRVPEELQDRVPQKDDFGIFIAGVQQESIVLKHGIPMQHRGVRMPANAGVKRQRPRQWRGRLTMLIHRASPSTSGGTAGVAGPSAPAQPDISLFTDRLTVTARHTCTPLPRPSRRPCADARVAIVFNRNCYIN